MLQEEGKGMRMSTEKETERKEKLLVVGRRGRREESSGPTPGEFEDAGGPAGAEGGRGGGVSSLGPSPMGKTFAREREGGGLEVDKEDEKKEGEGARKG